MLKVTRLNVPTSRRDHDAIQGIEKVKMGVQNGLKYSKFT